MSLVSMLFHEERVRTGDADGAFSREDADKIAKMRHTSHLWEFHPVPEEPEPSLQRRTESLRAGRLRATGASVRGRKHIHNGTNCDDWFELREVRNPEAVVIAVSDGAGSRTFSRIGAKVSCRAAADSVRRALEALAGAGRSWEDDETLSLLRQVLSNAMQTARDALYEAFAQRIGRPGYGSLREFRDLSATLLLLTLIPLPNGECVAASCQVGDGTAVLLNADAPYEDALSILGAPDSGEYAGETKFLTSSSMTASALARRVAVVRGRFDYAFVMTDGVADDYFPADPELFRLYFDLCANGALPPRAVAEPGRAGADVEPPAPLAFPMLCEDDGSGRPPAPLNYTWLIRSVTGRSLRDLWDDSTLLAKAAARLPAADDGAERLLYWLEHYTESASFDDRTLALVRIGKGDAENG